MKTACAVAFDVHTLGFVSHAYMVMLMHNIAFSVTRGFGSVLAPFCACPVEVLLLDERDVGTQLSVSAAAMRTSRLAA